MSYDLIKQLFATIDGQQWETLGRLFDADVIYERPGYEPFVGIERLMKFYREERILSSGQHYIEQIIIDGDHGACYGRFVGLKKDNTAADEMFVDVYCFNQDKIKTRRSYFFRPAV